MYTLSKLSDEGHRYATREMLLHTGAELLTVDELLLSSALDRMITDDDVKTDQIQSAAENGTDNLAIYLPPFYYSEVGTARRLHEIITAPISFLIDNSDLENLITAQTGMQYDEIQMQAIKTAVQNKVMILTGGPGTGKTTTTLGIIRAFQLSNATIVLAAPTGRACKAYVRSYGLRSQNTASSA